MHTDCLVRKLRIRTGEKSLLTRITFLIEDSLRTTSFQGIPPNGVVYIKSMDLGRFSGSVNASFLAARIESFTRNLRLVRIGTGSEPQGHYTAVWFPDELEPCRILTQKLISGHLPDEWFWQAAVKGYSAEEPIQKNIRNIISQVIQKKNGISGLAYVLDECFHDENILEIIDYLEEKQCSTLLSFLELEPFKNIGQAENTPDNIKKDDHLYFPDAVDRIIEKAICRWGIKDSRTVFFASLVLVRNDQKITHSALNRKLSEILNQISINNSTVHPIKSTSPTSHKLTEEKQDYPSSTESFFKTPHHEGIPPDNTRIEKDPVSDRSNAFSEPTQNLAVLEYGITDDTDIQLPDQQTPCHPFAGTFSSYSGFPLLINVLERLNIKAVFTGHPDYPAGSLQEAILWRIAGWQKIPQKDVAAGFLSNFKDIMNEIEFAHFPFTYSNIIEKIHPHNQEYFSSPLSRRPMKPLNLKQMLNLFLTAVSRYVLKRSGGMSVSDFIKRPAYIAITETHMDITASIRTIDIHIRSAGLDINPGWIPWLGRVFQIHYTEEVI